MENASKALIIAGAILLAIVLISLGMVILGQGEDIVKNNGMNQAQITALNNQFLKYEGKQKGSVVKSMMGEVKAVNADENNKNAGVEIKVKKNNAEIKNTKDIDTAKTYNVSVDYGDNGYVSTINIE